MQNQLILWWFREIHNSTLSKRKIPLKNSLFPKINFLFNSKMTTRSQKRKAVAELASGEFEASMAENNLPET